MKNLFPVFFCILSFPYAATAQPPLTLRTAAIRDVKTVVLPTFDNFLMLLRANDMQYKAAMRRYGYRHDSDFASSGFLNTEYWITKDRDPETKALYVSMDLGPIKDEMAGYLDAFEADIKKRFPQATHLSEGHNESYVFVVKDAHSIHHYKAVLDRSPPTEEQGGATLTMID